MLFLRQLPPRRRLCPFLLGRPTHLKSRLELGPRAHVAACEMWAKLIPSCVGPGTGCGATLQVPCQKIREGSRLGSPSVVCSSCGGYVPAASHAGHLVGISSIQKDCSTLVGLASPLSSSYDLSPLMASGCPARRRGGASDVSDWRFSPRNLALRTRGWDLRHLFSWARPLRPEERSRCSPSRLESLEGLVHRRLRLMARPPSLSEVGHPKGSLRLPKGWFACRLPWLPLSST